MPGDDRVLSFKTTPYVNELERSLELKQTESIDCLTFELERDREEFGEPLLKVGKRLRLEVKQCW